MIGKDCDMTSKEEFVQSIIKCYCDFQSDLMVQEDNIANDFCWAVYEALSSLSENDRRIIFDHFFKNKRDINDDKCLNDKIIAIDKFVEKLKLKMIVLSKTR